MYKMVMKSLLLLSLVLALSVGACAQHKPVVEDKNKIVRRIKIHSADPMLIAILLNGKTHFLLAPEQSTVIKR